MPKKAFAAVAASPPSEVPADDYMPLSGPSTSSDAPQTRKTKGNKRKSQPVREDDAGQPTTSTSSDEPTSVVYVGHIPHGFYEKQLLGFFSQFGKLVHVRLSRTKKTGASKHYAFLKFQHAAVAAIAAEAMDGYFLMKKRLTCRVLKASQVHPKLFVGASRKKFYVRPWLAMERDRHNAELTPKQRTVRVARAVSADRKRQARIAKAGIDFDYPALSTQLPVKAKKTVFDD